MEFTTASLVTGLFTSSIGFSLFLYGKKQGRAPQLVAGLVLMALPVLAPAALLQASLATAVILGTVAVCRASA
ncbi:MAG: amino acid transport protein [Planctomycetes bacterium]|nr:amino acid transport protein [Planctomycetota bacterium]MCB9887807.1 amino acid transport protein [Planctomycetota bacterium]